MSGTIYKVIFSGEVEPAADQAVVMAKFTEKFKLSQEQAEALFSGRPNTLKKCRDLESAQKLARTISRIGAVCRIVPPDATPQADVQDNGERDEIPTNGSSQEYADMAKDASVRKIVPADHGSSGGGNASASLIKLEGNATPNLILSTDETVLLDLSQGWRDLGIMAKFLGHKGRFIATNKRAIYFKKKTKDFDIQQMRMSHAGFVHMGYSLQFLRLCSGLFIVLAGVAMMMSQMTAQPDMVAGAGTIAIGGFMMWTSRVQGLTLSGSGDKIRFATKSVSQEELSKILTVVNAG